MPHALSSFSYDYRSRRYYRGTPKTDGTTNHMVCVFDGGLSIQEYSVGSVTTPTITNLTTEFIRGEGMGGGVGGMVYSLKKLETGNVKLVASHSNHRGDIIARSDEDGSLTSFALYEAYGTRPYEWPEDGSGDPDRQKANTKEEEKDLGLLNEGMRYRDLETGTFLTGDPIGYKDGPNRYCYVHCNPITHFDAHGLWTFQIGISTTASGGAGGTSGFGFAISHADGGGWFGGWEFGGYATAGGGVNPSFAIRGLNRLFSSISAQRSALHFFFSSSSRGGG